MNSTQPVSLDVQTAVNIVATWGAWQDGGLAEDVLHVLGELASESPAPGAVQASRIRTVRESLQAALHAGLVDGAGAGEAGTALRPRVEAWLAAAGAADSAGPELVAQADELLPAVLTAAALILDQRISSLAGVLAAPEAFPDSSLCIRVARGLPSFRDAAEAGDLDGIVAMAGDAGGLLDEVEALRARLLLELEGFEEKLAGEGAAAGSQVGALKKRAGEAQAASLGELAALVSSFQQAVAQQESADEEAQEAAAHERLTTAMEALRRQQGVVPDLDPVLTALLQAAGSALDGSPAKAMSAWSDSLEAALATLETMAVEIQLRESEFVQGQLQRVQGVQARLAAAAGEHAAPQRAALDQAIRQLEAAAAQEGGGGVGARPALEQAAGALAATATAAGDSQDESPENCREAIKELEEILAGHGGHLSWATFRAATRLRDALKLQGLDPAAQGGLEKTLAEAEETVQRGQEEAEASRARLQELQSGALERLRGEFKAVSGRLPATTRQRIESGFSKVERTLDDEDDISPEVLAGLQEQVASARRPIESKAFGLGACTLARWQKHAGRQKGKAGAAAKDGFKKGQQAAKHLQESLQAGQVAPVEKSTGELRQILWLATGGALRRIVLATALLVILGGGTLATMYYLNQPHQVDLGFDAAAFQSLTAAGGRLLLVSADGSTVREIDGPVFSTTAADYDLFVAFGNADARTYVRHIKVPSPAYPPVDLDNLIP